MTTIHLQLPDDLANKALNMTSNIETLLIDLLTIKINETRKPSTLANEYKQAGLENRILLQDFNYIDNEGWDEEY